MFLQTYRHTRRKFLKRSALGAGGVLFSSMLLESCMTDHLVPPTGPGTPVFPPLVGDDTIDWNDDAKTIVSTALGLIPEGGEILSGLVDIFWPSSGGDVWDQVKGQVDELITKELGNYDYNLVKGNLQGLKNVADDYTYAINHNGDIQKYWNTLYTDFALYEPNFQQDGFEVRLLPLFAQFANMYLSLLRDGVVNGVKWGIDTVTVQKAALDLAKKSDPDTSATGSYAKYVTDAINGYTTKYLQTIPRDDANSEPFKSTNAFNRQMTLWVLGYMDTWPYYNVTKYPNGAVNPDGTAINLFNREIYSDPYGNTFTGNSPSTPIALPSPATQRPTSITVWSGSRIDAVQLTYANGGGPGSIPGYSVTQTDRMGDQNGGSPNTFNLSPENPIIQARVSYESHDYFIGNKQVSNTAVDSMFFTFSDGSTTRKMGVKKTDDTSHDSGDIGYLYMALSSIYIHGVSAVYNNSADCIVFGFLYWQSPLATSRAIRKIYITSPQEHSMADFAKAFPGLGISDSLVTDEVKEARKKHWEAVEARAKKVK